MPSVTGASRVIYFDQDLTGVNPNNLVVDEFHQVKSYQKSLLKPIYGKFYSESLRIFTLQLSGDLVPLTEGTEFVFAEYDVPLSMKTGRDVYKSLMILSDQLPGVISITYQAVGGSDAVDTASTYSQATAVLTEVSAIDYDAIGEKPDIFLPSAHLHDLADFYGTEYLVKNLADLKSAIVASKQPFGANLVPYKDVSIWLAVKNFKTVLANATRDLQAGVKTHLATLGYKHDYTAAMVGLGNLSNYSFSPTTNALGQPNPIFASPAVIKAELTVLPAQTSTAHAADHTNPHGDTAASIGLGNVANLGFLTAYTTGVQAYTTLLYGPPAQLYVTPYVAVTAVAEYQADQVAANVTPQLAQLTDPTTGSIAALTTTVNALAQQVTTSAQAVSQVQQSAQQVTTSIAQIQQENRRFKMVEYNRPLAQALQRVLALDHASFAAGYGVGKNGLWSLPPNLDNLYLWLDVDYEGNTTRADSAGVMRLTALQDRSVNQRLFVANSNSSAPLYQDSADIVDGKAGVTLGKVARFRPGHYLDQITGPAVTIQPGMTIFMVVRPGLSKTSFTVLTDVTAVPKATIVAQGDKDKALSITSNAGWVPLLAPDNTSLPGYSNLIVASISETSEAGCWLASGKPNSLAKPRGVDTNASAWVVPDFQSTPLSRIGTEDSTGTDTGELSQLIIYNRQLSFAECEAVVAYLRLAKTNNQALGVDMSAQNAF